MLLNLADLALRGGDRFERTYPLDLQPIVLGGVDYCALAPDGVQVAVARVTGGYLVNIALDARIYGPCARCLREAGLHVRAEQQEFAPTAKDGWGESEASDFIKDLVVDVDGLAREALVLAMPAQVVCEEECKGLCPQCGKDLNQGPCTCAEEHGDERWSKLKGLSLGAADEAIPDDETTGTVPP